MSEKYCEEIKTDYVEISSHIGARVNLLNPIANHAGWQGKVFKIHGFDEKYGNLKNNTGYPDDILGLGGVNCRHRMFPFVPGISVTNPIQYDEEKNRKAYELSQAQRRRERAIRQLKKEQAAAKACGDTETAKKKHQVLNEKYAEMNAFCDKHGLKRDYDRELVTEQIVKTPNVDNNAESGIINKLTLKPDIQHFAKKSEDFKTIHLPKSEYAHVMSEISTNLTEEQNKRKVFSKAIGNNYYTVENNGFGNYRVINKKKIEVSIDE